MRKVNKDYSYEAVDLLLDYICSHGLSVFHVNSSSSPFILKLGEDIVIERDFLNRALLLFEEDGLIEKVPIKDNFGAFQYFASIAGHNFRGYAAAQKEIEMKRQNDFKAIEIRRQFEQDAKERKKEIDELKIQEIKLYMVKNQKVKLYLKIIAIAAVVQVVLSSIMLISIYSVFYILK